MPLPSIADAEEALQLAEDLCANLLQDLIVNKGDEAENSEEPPEPREEEDDAEV